MLILYDLWETFFESLGQAGDKTEAAPAKRKAKEAAGEGEARVGMFTGVLNHRNAPNPQP